VPYAEVLVLVAAVVAVAAAVLLVVVSADVVLAGCETAGVASAVVVAVVLLSAVVATGTAGVVAGVATVAGTAAGVETAGVVTAVGLAITDAAVTESEPVPLPPPPHAASEVATRVERTRKVIVLDEVFMSDYSELRRVGCCYRLFIVGLWNNPILMENNRFHTEKLFSGHIIRPNATES
jgi:hypothetical protein